MGNILHVRRRAAQTEGAWGEVRLQGLLPRKHPCDCDSERGICVAFCVQSPGTAGPHVKCRLYLQCQDLFQHQRPAAHRLLWCITGAIKGWWCQGPDGFSVLGCQGSVTTPACSSCASHTQQGAVAGGGDGTPGSRGRVCSPARAARGVSAVALRAETPLLPWDRCSLLPRCFCLPGAAAGQKSSATAWALPGAFLVCFISTRCLSSRCLSQRQTNSSPWGAFPVT